MHRDYGMWYVTVITENSSIYLFSSGQYSEPIINRYTVQQI